MRMIVFSYLYPDLDKEEMLRFFDTEERHKSESPTGYIGSEVIMVAKTMGFVKVSGNFVILRDYRASGECHLPACPTLVIALLRRRRRSANSTGRPATSSSPAS